jgi:hypothetical protein
MSLAAFALVASPLLAFLAVLLGHRVTRTSARELDRWRKREETMRLLRWATDLAVDAESAQASIGIAILEELLVAPILDEDDQALVATVGSAVARSVILDEERGHPP